MVKFGVEKRDKISTIAPIGILRLSYFSCNCHNKCFLYQSCSTISKLSIGSFVEQGESVVIEKSQFQYRLNELH